MNIVCQAGFEDLNNVIWRLLDKLAPKAIDFNLTRKLSQNEPIAQVLIGESASAMSVGRLVVRKYAKIGRARARVPGIEMTTLALAHVVGPDVGAVIAARVDAAMVRLPKRIATSIISRELAASVASARPAAVAATLPSLGVPLHTHNAAPPHPPRARSAPGGLRPGRARAAAGDRTALHARSLRGVPLQIARLALPPLRCGGEGG